MNKITKFPGVNDQTTRSINIDEAKSKFAKSIAVGSDRSKFRDFLNTQKCINMFNVLYNNQVHRNMSSILGGTRANAKQAFEDLYDLWFDNEGNKTKYLQTLEKNGVYLSNLSSILSGARGKAQTSF